MIHLPDEIIINILSFLSVYDLHACGVSKPILYVYRSNVVWKPIVTDKFGEIKSSNYFKEYGWQLKLKKHQFSYKRQWTLGCVGRIMAPEKPEWDPAIF